MTYISSQFSHVLFLVALCHVGCLEVTVDIYTAKNFQFYGRALSGLPPKYQ